jgi:hypothetical protein
MPLKLDRVISINTTFAERPELSIRQSYAGLASQSKTIEKNGFHNIPIISYIEEEVL